MTDATLTKETMKAISAPYNFVPLASWVYIPAWGPLVSHDVPFRDGLCGEIHYRLTAASPLLVGGHQTKATEQAPGEVEPFQLPDGRYAISGASLRGMIRAVIEIAGFGRMRMVDDARPGLRDITGRFVKDSYTNKVRDKVQTGFLRQGPNGPQIVPCRKARLDHRHLATWLGVAETRRDHRKQKDVPDPIFNRDNHRAVAAKYKRWCELCAEHGISDPFAISVQISGEAVTGLSGPVTAFPVLTGQISDFRDDKPDKNSKGKYKDFVFYDPREGEAIDVPVDAWRDFLRIHGEEEKKNADMSWPGYWRREFQAGRQVPVFYLQDGPLLRIGLAYMPKLAGDYSIHDLIRSASPAHLDVPGRESGYDLADLLFGAVNSECQADALRGRVSFETAIAKVEPKAIRQADTILNGPKPTYFPNYVTQKTRPGDWKLATSQYATYVSIETPGAKLPTLRGFKRYPARPAALTKVQRPTADQKNTVKVRLHTLEEGSTFEGRIVFHNLEPAELGALAWALTWGGNPQLCHGLGMGKSFGFGQVRFDLDIARSQVIPNDPQQSTAALDQNRLQTLMNSFRSQMEEAAERQGGWETSPQISNLLAMADPDAAPQLPAGMELRHMRLEAKAKINEFQWAKQEPPGPFVLADYANVTGWGPRWRNQVRERQEQARRLAEQKAAEEEEARLAAATKDLPEDAAELLRMLLTANWRDKGEFVQTMLEYLDRNSVPSTPALARLSTAIEEQLPGLLANPRAAVGKKKKPKFKPKQIELAERVIALST